MKTRYRIETVGGIFNKRHVLILQVLKQFPDGPDDFNGLPEYLAHTAWVDASVEDLQELKGE